MISTSRLLLTLVTAIVPFLGQSQDKLSLNFTFQLAPRHTFTTLDDLSSSLLNDPYVMSEIGVRKPQMVLVPFRAKWNEVISLTAATQSTQEDLSDEDKSAITAELTKRQNTTPGLKLDDLDAKQRQKLKKVALRDNPLSALFTSEVSFAMQLSNEQLKRLMAIRTDYWNRCSNIESKYSSTNAMAAAMKEMQTRANDATTMAQRMALTSELAQKMERWMGETAAKIEAPIAEATAAANKRALAVLTASQAKRYQALMK